MGERMIALVYLLVMCIIFLFFVGWQRSFPFEKGDIITLKSNEAWEDHDTYEVLEVGKEKVRVKYICPGYTEDYVSTRYKSTIKELYRKVM